MVLKLGQVKNVKLEEGKHFKIFKIKTKYDASNFANHFAISPFTVSRNKIPNPICWTIKEYHQSLS